MPILLLLLAYLGFISLGLPDATLGIIWPSLRTEFTLPQSALGLVLVFGTGGYLSSSLLAGTLIKRLGVGNLLAASTLLMVTALTGYSLANSWAMFLASAFISGIGSGAIDAGLNTYAASRFSEKHMNWLHGCYSVGATLGPVVLTAVLSAGSLWRWGIGTLALLMFSLGIAFVLTRQRWNDSASALAAYAPRRFGEAASHHLVGFQTSAATLGILSPPHPHRLPRRALLVGGGGHSSNNTHTGANCGA